MIGVLLSEIPHYVSSTFASHGDVKAAITIGTLAVTVGLCVCVYRLGVNTLNQIKSLGLSF